MCHMILTLFYFIIFIPHIDYIPTDLDIRQQMDSYMFSFDMVLLHNTDPNIYYILFRNHEGMYIFPHFVVMN